PWRTSPSRRPSVVRRAQGRRATRDARATPSPARPRAAQALASRHDRDAAAALQNRVRDLHDEWPQRIDWDTRFETFDERGLAFVSQERLQDGTDSSFSILTSPDGEDA
ncbi:MAG: hypothetical protein AB1416_12365, partial [Actinomycetota bacterium]